VPRTVLSFESNWLLPFAYIDSKGKTIRETSLAMERHACDILELYRSEVAKLVSDPLYDFVHFGLNTAKPWKVSSAYFQRCVPTLAAVYKDNEDDDGGGGNERYCNDDSESPMETLAIRPSDVLPWPTLEDVVVLEDSTVFSLTLAITCQQSETNADEDTRGEKYIAELENLVGPAVIANMATRFGHRNADDDSSSSPDDANRHTVPLSETERKCFGIWLEGLAQWRAACRFWAYWRPVPEVGRNMIRVPEDLWEFGVLTAEEEEKAMHAARSVIGDEKTEPVSMPRGQRRRQVRQKR